MSDVDGQGRVRKAVHLPAEMWEWLEAVAERDGTSRSDLLEGIVLLAMDDAGVGPRSCRECGCTDYAACDEGCCWAEEDLCSACVEPARDVVTVKVSAGVL